MSSVAEQLADLINPNPTFDPEDDIDEETRARLVDKELLDVDEEVSSSVGQKLGGLRKSLALRDNDPRYGGKVVSRRDLNEEDSDQSFDDSFEDSEDDLDNENSNKISFVDESEDEDALEEDDQDSIEMNDSVEEDDDDMEEEESEKEVMEDDEEVESEESGSSDEDNEYEPGLFKEKKSVVSEKDKGKDTMNQLSLWECILEARIKIQKFVGLSNQVPRPSTYGQFLDQGGDDLASSIKNATSSLTKLGSEMFGLQEKLLGQVEGDRKASDNHGDSLQSGDTYSSENWNKTIEKRCSRLRKRRSRILKFWYDKTLLSTNKVNKSFSSFERPTVAQIDHILADRDRLIRRTRVQRTKYRVLGDSGDKHEEEGHDSHLKEIDEVFDDDDFYQQLLRQFIEQKTSQPGSSDTMQNAIEMTRKWLKLQQYKTKSKKDFDHKTRKGKKIRYVVHPKLLSFMAPSDKSSWTHESRNQLVKSIFGKTLISNNGS